ncbi:MAG: DUF4397 domain-containing protein [Cyclonatronaceae bacterium]
MTRFFLYALAVTLLVVTMHACDILETDKPFPEGEASVRVVHIAPLASESISYFHRDELLFTNLDFGDVTEYVDVPVGRNIDGFLDADGDTLIARDGVSSGGSYLDEVFLDFTGNYTVFALHGSGDGNVHIRSMEVEPTPNAEGNSRVRILHAVSGAPEIDVYLTEPGSDISSDNLFLFEIPFNNEGGAVDESPATLPLYSVAEPGTYEVKVTVSDDNDVIFTQEVTLEANGNYTMVFVPTETNDGIERVMLLADN